MAIRTQGEPKTHGIESQTPLLKLKSDKNNEQKKNCKTCV